MYPDGGEDDGLKTDVSDLARHLLLKTPFLAAWATAAMTTTVMSPVQRQAALDVAQEYQSCDCAFGFTTLKSSVMTDSQVALLHSPPVPFCIV